MDNNGWGTLVPDPDDPPFVRYFEHYFTQTWKDSDAPKGKKAWFVEVHDATKKESCVFVTDPAPTIAMALSRAQCWVGTETATKPSRPLGKRRRA